MLTVFYNAAPAGSGALRLEELGVVPNKTAQRADAQRFMFPQTGPHGTR